MAELIEDDIIGEDLDYEEYDLDEEEEEALLADNEEANGLSKHTSIKISINQDTEGADVTPEENSLNYHLDEEEDNEHLIEEEEDEDEYDSTNRDRFKSERTKVSLTEPSKTRNIPDSLDDVKTTEVHQDNQRRGMNRKQRFLFNKRNRKNNQRRMQNQPPGYQKCNNFNNWESPFGMGGMPPQLIQPPFNPMMDMHHLHGAPIRISPYGDNFRQPPPLNPYMMNSPQILPQISLKRSFSDTNSNKHPKLSRTVDTLQKQDRQMTSPNHPKLNNPNLTVINTVEIPSIPMKQPSPKKSPVTNRNQAPPAVVVAKNLTPEETEYQLKLEEQKRKRAEILARKEMRRQEAAKKAQLKAPPPAVSSTTNVAKAKEAMKTRAQRLQLLEGFHDKPQESNNSNFGNNQLSYPGNRLPMPMAAGQEGSFALRNLVGAPVRTTPPHYTPSLNVSIPPPRLAVSARPFLPMGTFAPPTRPVVTRLMIPPPTTRPPSREPPFTPRFHPAGPPPMSVSQPIYHQPRVTTMNRPPPPSRITPTNVPPPMTAQYVPTPQLNRPLAVQQAPTITLNFPPPSLSQPVMPAQSDYYGERMSAYSDPEYASINIRRPPDTPEYNHHDQSQVEDGLFSQRYRWKTQRKAPVRLASSESNITIKTADRYGMQPVKRVKKFKRIIRKNKNGEVLLIKKLVLDEDGNATGVEEIEFMHDDFIAEKVSMKQSIVEAPKKVEPVQEKTVSISNKHFRGADHIPINKMGEGIKRTTYPKLASSQPMKRIVTTGQSRLVRPARSSANTVMLSKIPSNVTVNELKDLADDDGLDGPKSILYDKAERRCSFEFADDEVALKFCKKMNGRMVKMSIIHANMV